MEVFSAIHRRKSIRSYTGEMISPEDLQQIILAGQAAPVGMSRYASIHITVIENQELLREIDTQGATFLGMPDAHPLYGAPALILVSMRTVSQVPVTTDYSNASMVLHNMSLAATSLGVGHCLIWGAIAGLNQCPELVNKLDIPEGFKAGCGLVVGITDESYAERDTPDNRISVSYLT